MAASSITQRHVGAPLLPASLRRDSEQTLRTRFWVLDARRVRSMIGVNSLHSAGRLRSRSLCTVRYGRDFRMMDPFRYPRTPRSRSLKPLVFPDLLGKAQDGQNHPQARKRRKVHRTSRSVSPVDSSESPACCWS
ncbi:hypothetical protein EYF80_066597 [Liparis tanakae]|uniref:Uncharacterized protein n=1 Tax=Liparis tanakae TaxID=230148 RepID=A0A4Z2E3R5_9TELE|nr:hypothetical protein EYF80_066597 [Liparis tanakae]